MDMRTHHRHAGDYPMTDSTTKHRSESGHIPSGVTVEMHYCIAEDQQRWMPKRRRAPPHMSPRDVPVPRQGEVVYLSSSSAWGVAMIIHEWHAPNHLRIEVWLEHLASSRQQRPPGFVLTQ